MYPEIGSIIRMISSVSCLERMSVSLLLLVTYFLAMVGVDSGSLYRWTHGLSHLAWSWVGGHLAPFCIHQMNRVNSRSTINIVLDIILLLYYITLASDLPVHTIKFRVVLFCLPSTDKNDVEPLLS